MRSRASIRRSPRRGLWDAAVALAFITSQLSSCDWRRGAGQGVTLGVNEAIARSFARPDLLDRHGRLLATDVAAPSLFADPALILDRDETVEKLVQILPGSR